jgi:hypothetical protein
LRGRRGAVFKVEGYGVPDGRGGAGGTSLRAGAGRGKEAKNDDWYKKKTT